MALSSLERIAPEEIDEEDVMQAKSLALHLERYRFAATHLKAGQVLDLACGVGYGSDALLKLRGEDISFITAVDIAGDAIDYAKKTYGQPKINFVQSNAMDLAYSGC